MDATDRHPPKNLKQATLVLSITTAAFMAMRFVEQYLLAHTFGVSGVLDAYFLGQIIVLIGSQCAVAVTSAAVPVIAARLSQDGIQSAEVTAVTLSSTVAGVCSLAGILLFFLAPELAVVFGGELREVDRTLAVLLLRCSIPATVLFVYSAALRGYWHARQNLLKPGLVQPLMALGSMICALLVALGKVRILALPIGALIGAFCITVVLIEPLYQSRQYLRRVSWTSRDARRFLRDLMPVGLSMVLIPIMMAVGRMFATRLAAGAIGALSLAASVMSIPGQLAATAIGTVILPKVSFMHSGGNFNESARLVGRAVRVTAFVTLPCAFALALYPSSIISLVFRGGAFDGEAVKMTSSALIGYSIGIPALAVMQVLVFALFAASAWIEVIVTTAASIAINFILYVLLGSSLFGLAMAFSLTCIFNCGLLIILLDKKLKGLSSFPYLDIVQSILKALAACSLSFGLPRIFILFFEPRHTRIMPLAQILTSVGLFLICATVVCQAEVREIVSIFNRPRSMPEKFVLPLQSETHGSR